MENSYKMNIKQGEDFKLLLEIEDSDGNPVDLTSHSFRGQIRRTASSPDVIASFSFVKRDQSIEPGKIEVLMSNEVSSDIVLDSSRHAVRQLTIFSYDIESENTDTDIVTRWLEGTVAISPEVTR
jgi:hypothetical protein